MDWDLLSYIQDNLSIGPLDPVASAFGIRHKLDGPWDARVIGGEVYAILLILLGPNSDNRTKLSQILRYSSANAMAISHYRSAYLYGLLVKENLFGGIIEDILGYTTQEIETGRAP